MEIDADLVLLTERRYEAPPFSTPYVDNILLEDRLLSEALQRRGVRTARVDWSRQDIDWTRVPCAAFRTTWDYFMRWPEFQRWLSQVRDQTRLINSADLVEWNTDKHYLRDLEARGLPIVPTRFFDRESDVDLESAALECGWNELVMKPAVSGGGRETYRMAAEDLARSSERFSQLVASEDMLLQEFVRDIVEGGEVTLVLFDGEVSHGVRKVAAPGEFRVQDDFGGTVHAHQPSADEVELAEAAAAACPKKPVYGRVDLVRSASGELLIMEVEIVEPELWLRFCDGAAQRFADALIAAMKE